MLNENESLILLEIAEAFSLATAVKLRAGGLKSLTPAERAALRDHVGDELSLHGFDELGPNERGLVLEHLIDVCAEWNFE